jgi:hypothetical protein
VQPAFAAPGFRRHVGEKCRERRRVVGLSHPRSCRSDPHNEHEISCMQDHRLLGREGENRLTRNL